MNHHFPSSTKNPPESSLSPAGLVESFDPVHSLLVTATAAKIKMESRQADVTTTAAVAGTMTRIWHIMPVVVVPAVAAVTWRVVTATVARSVVAGAVTWRVMTTAVARCVMAAAMPGTVPTAMTGTMTGGVMISRLHRSRSEDGEAGGDGQEGDELFHEVFGVGLESSPRMCGMAFGRGAHEFIQSTHRLFHNLVTPSQTPVLSHLLRRFFTVQTNPSTQHPHGLAN